MTDQDDMGSVVTYRTELLEALADEKTLDCDADEGGYVIENDSIKGWIMYMEQADESECQYGMEKYGAGYPGDDELGTHEIFMGDNIIGVDADEVADIKDKPIGEFVIKEYGRVINDSFHVPIKEH